MRVLQDCCLLYVAAPTGRDVKVCVTEEADSDGFTLAFTPIEVGPHRLKIKHGSQCLEVEALTVMAYDSSAIKVMGVKDGLVDCQPSRFIGTC